MHETKQARAVVDSWVLGVKQAAARHGVRPATISTWRKKAKTDPSLKATVARILDASDREWLECTKSLVALCAKRLRQKVEADELDPFVLFEILKEGSTLLVTAGAMLGDEVSSDSTSGGAASNAAASGGAATGYH